MAKMQEMKYYIYAELLHQLGKYPPKLDYHMLALQGTLRAHLVKCVHSFLKFACMLLAAAAL